LSKIEINHPRATIFILDCCRSYLKSREGPGKQRPASALLGPSESLISFSCGPGRGAIDDSQNNRNGIFTEHLLKHLTTPTDIETILQMVARDIRLQGYPLPYRTSCLSEKNLFDHKRHRRSNIV